MSKVYLKDVVARIKDKVDKDNADLEYYIGGEHFDNGEIQITKKGVIAGSTIGPAFHMKFVPGDVLLMSRNPHLRKAGVVDFEGICSDVSYVCRTKDENVLMQRFLPFIFQSDDFWRFAEENKKGSTNFFLNWSDFEKYEFNLPPIETQRKLVEILWSFEDTKTAYKKLLEKTDELVKSQFIEMADGAPVVPLSEICSSYGRGRTPKYVEESNVHVLNQACIYWDGFKLENVKYQDESKFKEINSLLKGDVLLNSTGTGTLGRTRVFDIEDEYTYMTDSHVTILRPDMSKILPVVLQYYFYDDNNQMELYRLCVFGSTSQAELSKEALGRMKVPVIEMKKQKRFAGLVKQSDKSKFELKQAITDVDNLAKALMQQELK